MKLRKLSRFIQKGSRQAIWRLARRYNRRWRRRDCRQRQREWLLARAEARIQAVTTRWAQLATTQLIARGAR